MLLWSYSPYLVMLRKKIDCDLAVYFRTDDYLSAPGVNVSRLRKLESEAAALADICIAVNELSLADLLRADSPELAAARRSFAAERSWAVRFDAIEAELARALPA